MRKPLNIAAGLFAFTFAVTLGVGPAQAQDPGVIHCPDGLIVYSGESCQTYDTESVPQSSSSAGTNSTARSAGTDTAPTQTTTDATTQVAAEPAAPAAEASKPEPPVVTKTEEKGVLDYLPRPVKYLVQAAQTLI